ncbi:MAG: M23 family metallopeptidase [Hyphomonadaceae bacterium]
MLRNLILIAASAASLAACATRTPAPYTLPSPQHPAYTQPRAPQPNLYSTAPRAPFHAELISCGYRGSNTGEFGARGESLSYTPYIQTSAGPLLRNPTEQSCLSSGFGWRNAQGGSGRAHNGLDLANASGGYVFAAGDGRVIANDWRGGYGLVVELDHGMGVRTLYAHLNESDANLYPGAFVQAGQPIARMGDTGNATGVHLHYEVSVDGLLVDPLHYGMELPQTPIY